MPNESNSLPQSRTDKATVTNKSRTKLIYCKFSQRNKANEPLCLNEATLVAILSRFDRFYGFIFVR